MKRLVAIAALFSLAILGACSVTTDRSLAQGENMRIWGDPVTIYPGGMVQRSVR